VIKDSSYTGSKSVRHSLKLAVLPRLDLYIASGLFLVGLVSRILFAGQYLYHWDSINFAFSLERFDVASSQPHIPGYILYVFLGRAVNLFFNDAQTTFVALSIFGSSMAAACLYLLGRDMFTRQVGLAASLFLLSSPLFWFYGEIALPHALDTFVTILAVWLLYRLAKGEAWFDTPAAVVTTAAWMGIAGGLRPQTQVFLLPLALYVAWRIKWKRSILAFSILFLVNLVWFIPLMVLNGGVSRYFEIFGQFSEAFNTTTSIFASGGMWGLARNLRKLSMYTLYGWGAALIPFLLAGAYLTWKSITQKNSDKDHPGILTLRRDDRLWVLFLWMAPAVAYYIFIHMGQQGLIFVFLPGLLIISAVSLFTLFHESVPYPQAFLGALIAINAYIFLELPTYPLGGQMKILTVDTIRKFDENNAVILRGIRENFSPENTMIIASWWRFPQYYLDQYPLIHFDVGGKGEFDEGQGTVADETQDALGELGLFPDELGYLTIDPEMLGLVPDQNGSYYLLLFDQVLYEFNLSQERVEILVLPDGGQLSFIKIMDQEQLYLGPEAFGIVSENFPLEGQKRP
jgi:hypothetical protein